MGEFRALQEVVDLRFFDAIDVGSCRNNKKET